MATRHCVPDAEDIVGLAFDPQAVHRPAVVFSPSGYKGKIGLMACCPLSTRIKAYPFEVAVQV
jgi:mRNA interferase MazF